MVFSVSMDRIEWSLDFRLDSVTLTVKDLVQERTISSQERPPAAWSLLLSQRQAFTNNHLSQVPIKPNQERNMEMRDEVLSSVGSEDMDTSGCQMSHLDDVDFHRESD